MFFTLFGYWVRTELGLPRNCYTTCSYSSSPSATQISRFSELIFLILCSPKMTIQLLQSIFRPYLCVSHPVCVLVRGGGGGRTWFLHNVLMQCVTLEGSWTTSICYF